MKASHFSPDTREFLWLLHEHRVRYLIVGGEAVIYYGYPRLTGDVDFFYDPDEENTLLLFKALQEFWDNDIPGLESHRELESPGYVIQFGVPPNRIDLINNIEAVEFTDAWKRKVKETVTIRGEDIPVNYIGLSDLIKNKRNIGRPKDQQDLNYLQQI